MVDLNSPAAASPAEQTDHYENSLSQVPSQTSLTSNDSFRLRVQRSEQHRTILMLLLLASLLILNVVRRWSGGIVMSEDRVFIPTMAIILAGMIYEAFVLGTSRRANFLATLLPKSFWWINAAVELSIPLGSLTILQLFSPRGEIGALSGPTILLLPTIILLSVLRLQPLLTLLIGIGAAAGHWALAAHAIFVMDAPAETHSVLLSYAALLLLCGLCGAIVAREVKRYVHEAVDEAEANEWRRHHIMTMEHDLSIAREIQRGLIPSMPPDLSGFDIAGMSRPADSTGGDYYDWQVLPDGRVLVVLADVSGHGIGPAIVMAICRAYARASALLIPQLGPLLERINSLIHDDIDEARFITLVIALADPKSSRLELLSAGHGPTFLYRAVTGTVETFGGDGLPLGLMCDQRYGQARLLDLASGDMLVLLTDGFFEGQRPSDDQAFGTARITDLLKQHAQANAAIILQRLDSAVGDFTAVSEQVDDMTAVVIKRR